jgi:hypothetical protein
MTGMSERLQFYREMGRSLRARRESLGLALSTVSKMSKLDIGELKEMERGDNIIECFSFFKLMEYYDCVEGVSEKVT